MKTKSGVTIEQFRQIALSVGQAVEGGHMGHPDFRANGPKVRIFASLSFPDEAWGMVKVKPEEQSALVQAEPDAFRPCSGAWGRNGCTSVRLASVQPATLNKALESAWNAATAAKSRSKPRKPAL